MMLGQMMQRPLLISNLLVHAERHHGKQQVVSRRIEGDVQRQSYSQLAERSRRMANALAVRGVKFGDRVATLAWNGYRHMELYYAVPGSGAVLHTLNPRLHPDQLVWIADHAEDQILFFDLSFLPLIEAIASRVNTIKAFVVMTDRAHMPAQSATSKVPRLLCYEELIAGASDKFDWPVFDENTASTLCYTSGATGKPQGSLYSHRSTTLHAYAVALPDAFHCSARDSILAVVPMFHGNAWGLPYVACMVGAKMVFPGPWLDGKSLHDLLEREGVTLAAGVPTVWQGLLTHVEANALKFSSVRRTIIGDAACPPDLMRALQERYDVQVLHAWGTPEMGQVGTASPLEPKHERMT
jgi:acyl-CoA synthetase (AMP-forming)/AMP-acid ligase II